MFTVSSEPLLHHLYRRENPRLHLKCRCLRPCSLNLHGKLASELFSHASTASVAFKRRTTIPIRAGSTDTALLETFQSDDVVYKEEFQIKRTETVDGKIFVSLDQIEGHNWQLRVGCSLQGKWILHWGVSHVDDMGSSEWDQPPKEMRPIGSVPIKDYAVETPLKKSSESDEFHEVTINLNLESLISAISFVLKDEETGAWYQHKGRDFKVPLQEYVQNSSNLIGAKRGVLGQLSSVLKSEVSSYTDEDNGKDSGDPRQEAKRLFEELPITKKVYFGNTISAAVRKCHNTANNVVCLETDIPGDVIVHWGVCRDDTRKWEIPAGPYPSETILFKNKAVRTLLERKEDGNGSMGIFKVDEEFAGFSFVLKLNESTWLNYEGNDFYVPLSVSKSLPVRTEAAGSAKVADADQEDPERSYTEEIIHEIRSLVGDISSQKNQKAKTKEAQETILQEIEKLAAEAYSIFRSSIPAFTEEIILESEAEKVPTPIKISSGTGSGFEIVCQGFNWESHKSGKWYVELKEKAEEIASLGFTVMWLPPPTESVSPEGYMPKDLYNLNSRYGTFDELKDLVRKLHSVGVKVLGDAVLNHRCAEYQNQNGVWNIFGGRLNWDDRAVVADDPHFQGRGNKSSGDNFHAAPNIDHSQDFVRKDIKEWLNWLREEIGYDGWRLDFVRGFWGGYVKDYLDSSKPYFAVGEYWDSLSYTYGEMDYNQDAHRQRIVDWINATSGTAGAFDVTTKGILHAALERCEYWRLSDPKGKPPGVVGWWPSRAVTFIENHDTGSTQGHWRFPSGKEMQGYAYILTHPGTPAVFFDHVFDYRSEIAALLSVRNRNKINCRSIVNITKADRDVYAAIIDEKVAVKIGPGHYEPPSGSQNWSSVYDGRDYKVWEISKK